MQFAINPLATASAAISDLSASPAAAMSSAGGTAAAAVDIHQAMIATEKASMSFELALAVRNKAVQAYQSVIGMQF